MNEGVQTWLPLMNFDIGPIKRAVSSTKTNENQVLYWFLILKRPKKLIFDSTANHVAAARI
jgi:hypothetical protein